MEFNVKKLKSCYPLFAQYLASMGIRNNTELENLHAGISPSSKTGDYSDVKVVTPFGEIPWNQLSRISDIEMRSLMLSIEKALQEALQYLKDKDALEKIAWAFMARSYDRKE